MTQPSVITVKDLRTYFYTQSKQAFIRSVDGVGFSISRGETLGVVGESGSGKSVTALSIMGLIESDPGIISGSIALTTKERKIDLLADLERHVTLEMENGRIMRVAKDSSRWRKVSHRTMKAIRGSAISMIFQDARNAMNPFVSIGRQICEAVRLHTTVTGRSQARQRALYWLEQVKIDSPRLRYHNNPYGLSGGMCQRAMIAMALACEPTLLIADEPTTGLDATIQSRIVDLLGELKSDLAVTTLLISHDIDVIHQLADHVVVMYGGTVLEQGPVETVLRAGLEPKHPYTAALLGSIPDKQLIRAKGSLKAIQGDVLDTIQVMPGCRFWPRCEQATPKIERLCMTREPDLIATAENHRVRCWRYFKG